MSTEDNEFEKKLNFSTEKWNKYVGKFIYLTHDIKKGISSEFEEISNKYKTSERGPYILSMMLYFSLTAGRPDIVDHLLNLGADPHLVDLNPDFDVNQLINDNDIDKKTVKKMEKIMKNHGYNVNLRDLDRYTLFNK